MKRVHRNILIVCAFLLAIVLLLPILVYIPPVQRKAIAYAEQWVCSQTPYCISIEQFTLKFPLRAALHNVVITTAYNDTMLTAGKMQADVALVPLINRKVEVRNISLHDASVDFISPDSTLSVTADIGCIGLENGDIRLIDNKVAIGHMALDKTKIELFYATTPDTAKTDTTQSAMWDIEIEQLKLSDIGFRMYMPEYIDTLDVELHQALLSDGNISLKEQDIDIQSIEIQRGTYRYIAQHTDNRTQDNQESAIADTIQSQPWKIRVGNINLSDNSATYITSTHAPTPGIDFTHINAPNVDLSLSNIYNRGKELRLSLDSLALYERSGLNITNAKCHFAMTDSGTISISDLQLNTPFSDVAVNAYIDMSMFDLNPDAAVQLLANGHLSCRDISTLYPQAAQYYIHPNEKQALMPINDNISVQIDINGIASDMIVDKLDISQMGVFTMNSTARISHPLDKNKRNITFSGRAHTTGHFSLHNYIPDSAMAQGFVMHPITLNAHARISGDSITADATVNSLGGEIDVNAGYHLARKRYDVTAHIHQIPLGLFMPDDTIGSLTARAHLTGKDFALNNPSTHIKAQVQLDSLYFRHYTYRNIDITAQIANEEWALTALSDLQELNIDIDANGLLKPHLITANLDAQIGQVDLTALHFAEQPLDIAGYITAEVVLSNIDSIIQADVTINDLALGVDEYRYQANTINLLAASDVTYSYIDLRTGDLSVNLSSDTGIKNLQPSLERLTQLVDTIFQKQRLDMDELHRGLPPFEFTAYMSSNNVAQKILNDKGIRLSKAQFQASNDSLFNLSGIINRLEISGIMLDTLTLDAYEKKERLNYRLAMDNQPGNMDELAHIHIEGFLSGNSTRLYCLQSNRKNDIGFLLGCKVDFLPQLIQFTLGPQEPIIGYKKWLLNKDNNLVFNYANHTLDANIRLSYDNSHLYVTTEDRRNKDVSGAHIDLQNIELSDWLSVSSLIAPMSGNLSANVYVDVPSSGIEATGTFDILNYKYNNTRIGTLHAEAEYILDDKGGNDAKLFLTHDGNEVLEAVAYIDNNTPKHINGNIAIDRLPLSVANAFLPQNMGGFTGLLSSDLSINGTTQEPLVNGYVHFDKASLQFNQIGASLTMSNDKVEIENSRLIFDNYYIMGNNNSPLNIEGVVNFERLNDIGVNLDISGENFQPINIKENRSSIIYGSVFTDVNTRIRGSLNDLRITGGISLLSGTNATYVMQSNSSLSSTDYSDMVSFISFADTAAVDKENEKRAKRQANFTATLGIDIDEGVQLGINLSSDGKNRIDLVGGGELLYTATALGDNRVSGRYNLTGGFVRYTPPFISQKIFNIEDGSNVSWNGDILNPMFNITAVQSQRSSVKSGDESRLVDFDITIKLTNTLKDLDISFDLATADDMSIDNELQALTPEQRESKALNMLLYNSYTDLASVVDNYSINDPLNIFLEYELNTWAQRTLRGVDLTFGVDNYGIDGTGTQRTDYSYQFSKSLFDNRLKVVIGGSYASNQDVTQNLSENLIDDISLEYRLDKRENMYLKVFRQTGYESIIEGEITQTGIGFMYRKQINSLLDFFRKKPQHKKHQATKEASDTTVNIIYTPINNITPTEITTDKEEP